MTSIDLELPLDDVWLDPEEEARFEATVLCSWDAASPSGPLLRVHSAAELEAWRRFRHDGLTWELTELRNGWIARPIEE